SARVRASRYFICMCTCLADGRWHGLQVRSGVNSHCPSLQWLLLLRPSGPACSLHLRNSTPLWSIARLDSDEPSHAYFSHFRSESCWSELETWRAERALRTWSRLRAINVSTVCMQRSCGRDGEEQRTMPRISRSPL